MRAVMLRVVASLRRGWKASALVALVVAVTTGAVLALAAGARRVSTAPDRYTVAVGGDPDGVVIQPGGKPRTDEISALPGVAQVSSITFVGAAVDGADGLNPFAGTGLGSWGRLISGRVADPAVREEFTANRTFAEEFDAEIGDRFAVQTWTQEQVSANGFESEPEGVAFEGVLVGLTDSPDDLDDPTPSAVFSTALLDDDVGVVTTLMAVRLTPGATREDLRTQLDALPDGSSFALDAVSVVSPTVRNAVSAQAQGLWAIAAVAALATTAAVGQILSRHARVSPIDRRRLVAIGAHRTQLLGEAVGRALVPAGIGLLVGGALAVAVSGLFPFGFVGRLEPGPGVQVDVFLLLPVIAVLLLALLAWVAVSAWLSQRPRRAERPSAAVELMATRAGTASAAAGVRFAFVRNDRDTGSVAGTLTGLTVAIVGLVAATAFALSLGRLVDDRARFGNNFDLSLGNGWLPAGTDLREALYDDEDVDSFMLLGFGAARVGTRTVELVGVDPVRGGLAPRLLAGRLPSDRDEVALGRLTAEQFDVSIDDELTLEGSESPATYRVVGLAVLPSLGPNTGVGIGALLTFDGLHQLDPTATRSMAAIMLRPGAPPTTAARLSEISFTPPGVTTIPAAIRNVARINGVPVLLTALLALLAGVTLAHCLIQSVRARRHDLAILRALGADRRCMGWTVHWQATALTIVPLVLGVPLGLLVGRLVFSEFVERIGAVPDPTSPVVLVIAVAAGFLLLANLVGAIPAARARHVRPAEALRVE